MCVHVSAATDGDVRQELRCHLLVDMGLFRYRSCKYRDWHREQRPPNLTDLAERGVSMPDLEIGLLLAGQYRHPRRFHCPDFHSGWSFWDARVTRRRWKGLLRRLEPLPEVRSYTEAEGLLSPDGREVLDAFDRAISSDLNAPAALPVLYRAQRHGRLPCGDRAVLAAVTGVLLPSVTASPEVQG
ncbi:hypothetical protein [Streptomyces sp. I05A-00742]|uniref:hypothetical protein n=1 Tax=Streptomyces sp. I05A-00742 TaxID=2732853 RepID=UPI001BB0DA7F|nr:hypothetical protein [Streptomyces sp. I05A-00742]